MTGDRRIDDVSVVKQNVNQALELCVSLRFVLEHRHWPAALPRHCHLGVPVSAFNQAYADTALARASKRNELLEILDRVGKIGLQRNGRQPSLFIVRVKKVLEYFQD